MLFRGKGGSFIESTCSYNTWYMTGYWLRGTSMQCVVLLLCTQSVPQNWKYNTIASSDCSIHHTPLPPLSTPACPDPVTSLPVTDCTTSSCPPARSPPSIMTSLSTPVQCSETGQQWPSGGLLRLNIQIEVLFQIVIEYTEIPYEPLCLIFVGKHFNAVNVRM